MMESVTEGTEELSLAKLISMLVGRLESNRKNILQFSTYWRIIYSHLKEDPLNIKLRIEDLI